MNIQFRQRTISALSWSLLLTGVCLAQTTERVSVDSLGIQGNSLSNLASISTDGRYVAFLSSASNLVPGDTNGTWDIFVHDHQTGVTERVSVHSLGTQGNGQSWAPSISANGRYVAFHSLASNLGLGVDTYFGNDLFVHDRQTGMTELVNVDPLGAQGDGGMYPSISADGRYVAFASGASNLVPGDTNGFADIFVRDRQTGMTERVSVDSLGAQGNGNSEFSSISADGRYVALYSNASNLVPGDTNAYVDIFVHDRQTGVTERVSVGSLGAQGNHDSLNPSISADGRYVAFVSLASNLVPGDTNVEADVFVHDRQTGMTELTSVDSLGTQGNYRSLYPSISADGRYVAFVSWATNLVPGDTYGNYDVFVHDRQTGVTERVSVDSLGTQGGHDSLYPSISPDGGYVAFVSWATNLVPGDTNGNGDIFVHDRWNGLGENSIYLTGPSTSPVLTPVDLSWQTTRGNSLYRLSYSLNVNRAVINGHNFDLGAPMTVLATGTNSTNGIGSFTSPPVPAAAAGHTIYFEVAARDGAGVLYDSNVVAVVFY